VKTPEISGTVRLTIAPGLHPGLDFRVDDCSELRTVDDEHCDLVIANYVLKDTPNLRGSIPGS
jgi:hypothetical protein